MPDPIREYQINKQQSNLNRLNSKLQERLGYSGIYSQRNPRQFFDNLSILEQEKLLQELKAMYYEIFTDYFTKENQINDQIDRFAETAFFVNLPIGKVVEIHMELIDDLARELKFKGLHSEYLIDYRLTLIDVISHLGEMYRRVITEKYVISNFAG